MPQRYDPIEGDLAVTEFDFETVYDSLDSTHERPCPEHRETAEAVCKILRWMVTMDPMVVCRRRRALVAGRRAFVLAWMIVPGSVGNGRLSLRGLADFLGTKYIRMWEIARRINNQFDFRCTRQNGGQKVA